MYQKRQRPGFWTWFVTLVFYSTTSKPRRSLMFLPASTAPIRAAVSHTRREEGDCSCFRRKQDRLLQLTSVWNDGTCSTSHADCTECSCSTRCRHWSSRVYNADFSWAPLASYSTKDSVQDGCPRFPLYPSVCPDVSLRDVYIHGRRSWTMSPEVRTPQRGRFTHCKLSRSDMGLAASALLARQSGTVCRANWGTRKLHCRCLDGNWRHFYFPRRSHRGRP